jgi:hypothetical protein
MKRSDFGPILIVISRDEVNRQDTSGPLKTLSALLSDRETIRANQMNVDISFSGYEDTTGELFEITNVRNYVHALDAKFPYWLYFCSRYLTGLQNIAYCHLLPFLTPAAQAKRHPQQLGELVEKRWGPALYHLCSGVGHTEAEANELLESAMNYFMNGRTRVTE